MKSQRVRAGRALATALASAAALACGQGEQAPGEPAPAAVEPAPAPAPVEPARLVGSAACAECHAEVAERWRGSDHARAMQEATPATLLGDFAAGSFRDGRVTWTFERKGDRPRVRSRGAEVGEYDITYAIGVDPLQQILIALPDGRLQPLHVAWDARPAAAGGSRWFSLGGAKRIAAGDPAHWKSPAMSANASCAECHTTGFQKGFDLAANRYASTWTELGVGCEACHGPGSRHVAWARAGEQRGSDRGLTASFAKAPAGRPSPEIETCAPCHSQRARITEAPHAGDPFLDGYEPALLEHGLYHDDGQLAHDEVYQWGSFVQSRKYAAGVRCSDCHEPHTGALRAQGNALCASCHAPEQFDNAAHHHHTAAPTPSCVDCHMTRHPFLSIAAQRDHAFHVPRPDQSVRLGTPNACSECHAKRGDAWAAKAVADWRGSEAEPSSFADRLHARQSGGSAAANELASLAGDAAAPAIARATALVDLADALTRAQVEEAARAEDPLLRLAAARGAVGLEPDQRVGAVAQLLGDPLRAVRIAAARSLAGVPDELLSDSQRRQRAHSLAELRAAQAVAADAPSAHVNLALLLQHEGDEQGAEASYLTALRLGDYFVPAYTNLIELYVSQERAEDANELLHRGLERVPDSPELHYAQGLLHGRRGETEPALHELAAAARLAPQAPYYAFVHAMFLSEAGRQRDALAVLRAAVARHPEDQELLGATAMIARDAGRYDEALTAAKRLAELFPEHPEVQAMIDDIENRRAGGPGLAPAPVTPDDPG